MPDALDFSKFGATPSVEPEPSKTIDFSRFGATPSTVDQVPQAPPEEFDSTGGEFGKGVARGSLVAASGFVNFVNLFADSPKLKATADSLMRDASMIPTKAGSIKDVLADPTLAPAYVSRVIGELAPQAVTAYLTGGTGAAVGRGLGLSASGVRVATGVGAAASSVPQEVGHIYHETGSKGAALAYGIPAGALDALSAERIIGKVFRSGTEEAKRSTWRQIVRDTVKDIPKAAGVESVTEAAQESLALLANKSADETYKLLTPDNGWRILESAVAGAIGGGVLGGGMGLASIPAQQASRQQQAQDLRLTRQVRDSVRELQRRQAPRVVAAPEAGTVRPAPVPVTEVDAIALNLAGVVSPVDQFVSQNRPSRPAPPPTPATEPASTLPGLGLANLVPVLETADGKIYPGLTHAQALASATESLQRGEITPEQFSAVMEAHAVDAQHKFLDVSTGQVLNRDQAGQIVGLNAPLDSENLPQDYKERNLPAARMVSVMTPAERNDYFERRPTKPATEPALALPEKQYVKISVRKPNGARLDTWAVKRTSPGDTQFYTTVDMGGSEVGRGVGEVIAVKKADIISESPAVLNRANSQLQTVSPRLGSVETTEEFNWLTGMSATGKAGIVELLSNDKVNLDPEIRRIGLGLLSKINPKYLDRLTFSVDANGMAGGEFIPWMNMARVAMNSTDPSVAAHEISHYLANFLTSKERGEVAAARAAEIAIARTDKSNADFFTWLDANGGSATSAEYNKWRTGADIDPNTIASLGTPFRFATSTEIALRTPKPFGISPDKNGFIAKNSLLAKMKNQVVKEELDALKPILDSLPDRVSAALLANRIQEQGPQLEVVKLNAKMGPGHPGQKYAEEVHRLETAGWKFSQEGMNPQSPDGRTYVDKQDGTFDVLVLGQIEKNLTIDELPGGLKQYYDAVKVMESMHGEEWRDVDADTDSATFNYQFVNPKPLKDMPGAVDILVRIPQGKPGESAPYSSPLKFTGGHFGSSDKNVVGWVRGYIETMPNGERVFHVFEVQSDWAQQDETNQQTLLEAGSKREDIRSEDPILAYYESAALKAAIRHARELGITKVAISDSETAALTEGHDKVIKIARDSDGIILGGVGDLEFRRIVTEDATISRPGKLVGGGTYEIEHVPGSAPFVQDGKQYTGSPEGWRIKITKEPFLGGDQAHYDQSLVGIMRKLTGSVPVLVDFGVHQNAVAKNTDVTQFGAGSIPRTNLIFKNPGGSPKTTITARVFDTSSIDVEIPAQMYRSSLYSVADPLYHLINDDEFFARYMSEAARRAVPAELRTIIEKVRDIILRILEAIREFAGANPDYWQELMRKFERGHFLVHENAGMLYERNNASTARSLPPIKGLPALRQYTGVDQGQDEASLIRTLTYEQNQPLVGHIRDLYSLLPRDVRAELPGLASRLAALVEVERTGGAQGQTPLRHYAVLVNALALQEEGKTLSGEIEKIVEDIQKQAMSKDKASLAEILAKQLEEMAQTAISDYKNFQISEKKKPHNEGLIEAINHEIKFLDSLRNSTDPLRRAIEIISESVTLEQLNDPNASTQSIVDIAKKRIVELTGAATWQQATIPAGIGKAGVPNDQLRIAVAVLQENQRLVQDLITYKELSDPAFAKIMREGEAEFDKHIAGLTYRELRSFLKTYHSVRSAKDRARQIYLKHRARMKDLIERLEIKVQAEDFLQSQVLGSVQFRTALSDAAREGFMDASIVRDNNGIDVLKRTYTNPLNPEETIEIIDGTTKEDYDRNIEAYDRIATWFEDARHSENLDPIVRERIGVELMRIHDQEISPKYDENGVKIGFTGRQSFDPKSGKRTPGPLNVSNILANLTGNSLQYAMQKIGGRAAIQSSAIFQARSEARRRVTEVRHELQYPMQLAILKAMKGHNISQERWVEEIAEPILASYNSVGSKQLKASDSTRYGHKISGQDMEAVRGMKKFIEAMTAASRDMDLHTAKLHPIRIKEVLSGREISRTAQGGTELIVPRRFNEKFISLLEQWKGIRRDRKASDTVKELVDYVQSGTAFEKIVLAHIYSTQRYPDYANTTRFKKAYREMYNQILSGSPPKDFNAVVESAFQMQTGADPAQQLTREEITREIITKELDQMVNKVLTQRSQDRASDTPGTQVSIKSGDNFLTKPRGQMIAPDGGYQYSVVGKQDVQWLTSSVLEVHEQLARDGLEKVQKMLQDYVKEWKDRVKHPDAQRESTKLQLSGEDWLNYREAKQMLNQVRKLLDKTSPDAFRTFIDEQFGTAGRRVWSILVQSLLQSATVLKNNLLGMNLRLWQMEAQWRGDGLWMGMPKWLLKLPTMAKNGIAMPMRDLPAFVVSNFAYRKGLKGVKLNVGGKDLFGEDALRAIVHEPGLMAVARAQVGGSILKRALDVQRAHDLGAAGDYGLRNQIERYITMFQMGGEFEHLDQTTAENWKGGINSLLGLFQETGGGVMMPKAMAPRKLEQFLNFQAIRHADRLLTDLTLNLKEALRDRAENNIDTPVTDAELLGDSTAKTGDAMYMRKMFNNAGLNLDAIITNLKNNPNRDLLTPAQWNSFVLEVAKELNMPSTDNRVTYKSGFARLMSSLMGYGMWYNERLAETMARDSRKSFDLAAVYRGMFFIGVIASMGVFVGTPIQRWLKRFFYNEEDQTGRFSEDNTAWRNIGVLWEQTTPFWPIIGSVMSQLYDARTGGGKLFNFLPISVATQALQSANEIGQTGNVFYPTVKLIRQWLPNTKIVLNRIPHTEGLMEVNSAGRILRSTAAGDVEVRSQKTGGAIKYSPVSTETQMAVNEMAKDDPDYEAIKRYRNEAVKKLTKRGASRADAERRFDLGVLARYPENTVFGRTLTEEERSRQQSRMGADQIARLSQVESSFNRYANTFGLRAPSRLRQPRTRAGSSGSQSLTRVGIGRRRRRTRLVRNRSLTRRRSRRLVRF